MPARIDKSSMLFGALVLGAASGVTQAVASSEKVFYAFERDFEGAGDGAVPFAGLIADRDGNLYGTTIGGGSAGEGTVFKLAPDRTETILHSFPGGDDGYSPEGGLIMDAAGNLYGTTTLGGIAHNKGTVFRIAPDGTETVLYRFTGGGDGGNPMGTLIADGAGNLYGTTYAGGAKKKGVVFKLTPGGIETVLHSFGSGKDGAAPEDGLIADGQGNFYGTTLAGGSADAGVAFRLATDGTETALYSFTGKTDGRYPSGPLPADAKFRHLYGETSEGGHRQGVVYVIEP